MIMRLWELRRRIGDALQGDKLPAVVQKVVNRSRNLTHLAVEKSSLWGAEVRDTKTGRRHVVNRSRNLTHLAVFEIFMLQTHNHSSSPLTSYDRVRDITLDTSNLCFNISIPHLSTVIVSI
jgi:hypothetical protein